MIATRNLKMPRDVWVCACFNAFYPGSANAQWHLVFAFAGRGTGVTADTPVISDKKSVVHAESNEERLKGI